MWKQRSRLNWFKEGDRNTRFFHANASSRFQKNLIEGIYDDEGLWQEDEKIVVKIFVDYYSELFTTCRPSKFIEIVDAVHPKVMEAMNSTLIREFLPGEVHWALKQMYTLKALGLDGMPHLWDARTRLLGQRTRVRCGGTRRRQRDAADCASVPRRATWRFPNRADAAEIGADVA